MKLRPRREAPSVDVIGLEFGRGPCASLKEEGSEASSEVCQARPRRPRARSRRPTGAAGLSLWEHRLASERPDDLVIATPSASAPPIAHAQPHRRHGLCEKPLATSREDAEDERWIPERRVRAKRPPPPSAPPRRGFNWRLTVRDCQRMRRDHGRRPPQRRSAECYTCRGVAGARAGPPRHPEQASHPAPHHTT